MFMSLQHGLLEWRYNLCTCRLTTHDGKYTLDKINKIVCTGQEMFGHSSFERIESGDLGGLDDFDALILNKKLFCSLRKLKFLF